MSIKGWTRVTFSALPLLLATASAGQVVDGRISRLQPQLYMSVPPPGGSDTSDVIRAITELSMPPGAAGAVPQTDQQFAARAQQLMAANPQIFALQNNAARLQLKGVRTTPTGKVAEYEQRFNGLPLIDSYVNVSMDQRGQVGSVSTGNMFSVPTARVTEIPIAPRIGEQAALDIVQGDLQPEGTVIEGPTIARAYLNEADGLTLVYVVRLAVQRPFGYWEYRIDSQTGRIAEKFDRRIKKRSTADTPDTIDRPLPKIALKAAPAQPRPLTGGRMTTARATIFNPNPVTTLNDRSLTNGARPAAFARAYVQVEIAVTEEGGRLHLAGPDVRIEDFEPGENDRSARPSTVPAAQREWTARRGDNAFNDVMSYYFVSSSMAYLRRIWPAELFPDGIAVDSDGVEGADNSHYVPWSDRLAFGHGCVDDNEDADVILHEFGHAITNHINPAWRGGDSDAIGEGFGDYWAVSYRLRMTNGMVPDSGKVFHWDGIDECWDGRRVDVTNATYDPAYSYSDHERMANFVSDELWSTPLVRALNELRRRGVSVEVADRIVLAGMSDIGPNFTMRQLAANTVRQARLMYPTQDYAAVFERMFRAHKILP